nr:unnamed protein product [Callosobruchus chinensis]
MSRRLKSLSTWPRDSLYHSSLKWLSILHIPYCCLLRAVEPRPCYAPAPYRATLWSERRDGRYLRERRQLSGARAQGTRPSVVDCATSSEDPAFVSRQRDQCLFIILSPACYVTLETIDYGVSCFVISPTVCLH